MEIGRLSVLPSSLQIQRIKTVTVYDSNPYDDHALASNSFRQALEGWAGGTFYGEGHNGVHNWIGRSPVTQ